MPHIVFKRYRNEKTRFVATLMPDGRIRENHDTEELTQQWERLAPDFPTRIASRTINSRLVITAEGTNLAASPRLHLAPDDIEGANLWSLEEAGIDEGGFDLYYIQADGTNYVWEAPAVSSDPGAAIVLKQLTGDENQKWRERNTPVDAFLLRSEESNQVIDVPGFAAGPTVVQQFNRMDGYNQMWEIVDAFDGKRIRSVSNGLYLTEVFIPIPAFVTGVKSFGIPVLGPESTRSKLQQWKMKIVTASPTGDIVTFENAATGNFLSIYNGQQNGIIYCHIKTGGKNQQWKVIY